ncbi:hypothetical protein OE88DRAFT_895739 [Heliocybe sulcata]|uniref:Uncharacterized protein n=1 Tax=Heliocybe sulcata TaxID=5364 RepID=A0A5C3MNM9_9AGAM|nr:hypothetical protein OE88DRAFT_895739 [Heliocybe sulcata]
MASNLNQGPHELIKDMKTMTSDLLTYFMSLPEDAPWELEKNSRSREPRSLVLAQRACIELHKNILVIEEEYRRHWESIALWSKIKGLPDELLSVVFEWGSVFTRLDLQLSPEEPLMPFEITVSHVCYHWRSVALSTPSLWTNIDVLLAYPLLRPLMYIERSRTCLIDVNLDFEIWQAFTCKDHFKAGQVLETVERNWDRVRSLTLKTVERFGLGRVRRLCNGRATPNLVYLSLSLLDGSRGARPLFLPTRKDIFAAGMPNLRCLRLDGCDLPPYHSSLTALTTLDLRSDATLNFDALEQALSPCKATLQYLTFHGVMGQNGRGQAIRLPALECLSLHSHRMAEFCAALRTPSLTCIHVDIGPSLWEVDVVREFVSCLKLPSGAPRYPKVHTLSLRWFPEDHLRAMMTAHVFESLPNIKFFRLGGATGNTCLRLLMEAHSNGRVVWRNLEHLSLYTPRERLLFRFLETRMQTGFPLKTLSLCRTPANLKMECGLSRLVSAVLYYRKETSQRHISPEMNEVKAMVGYHYYTENSLSPPQSDDDQSLEEYDL